MKNGATDQERQNIIYPVTDRINQDHANQIERIKQNLIHEKQIHAAEIERIKQELELVKSERDYYKDMVLKHIFNKN